MRALLLLLAAPAAAQPFDPAALSATDARFLQAALVWSGDYVGLADGSWGPTSQDALDAWVAREGGDVRPLLIAFLSEVEAAGWDGFALRGALSVALPAALLERQPAPEGELIYATPNGSLRFRAVLSTIAEAVTLHDAAAAAHAGPQEAYLLRRDDRLVTAVTLADGADLYLRSAVAGGGAATLEARALPSQEGRLELIASSMGPGPEPDLALDPAGPLARLLGVPP